MQPAGESRQAKDLRITLEAGAISLPDGISVDDLTQRVQSALDLAVQYGGIDTGIDEDLDKGVLNKAWVIDQMVRVLAGEDYDNLVARSCDGEDGPETYDWKVGVVPDPRTTLEAIAISLPEDVSVDDLSQRVQHAIGLAVQYGGIDEDHHKAWAIDQMIRVLAAEDYDKLIAHSCNGEDGSKIHDWYTGISP